MNFARTIPALLAIALAFPFAVGGSPEAPDAVDERGDAAAPLDITSAWFTTPRPRAVALTFQVNDFGAAVAPAADADLVDTAYYFQVDFTSDSVGTPTTVQCWVSGAYLLGAGFNVVGNGFGAGSGCSRTLGPGGTVEPHVHASGSADAAADRFTITMDGVYVTLESGSTLREVTLTTWSGPISMFGLTGETGPADSASSADYAVGS